MGKKREIFSKIDYLQSKINENYKLSKKI